MIGEKKLKQSAQKVLSTSKADETEVLLFVSENGLTRFANSEIHQNMAWDDIAVSVRVIIGKKIGVASIGGREVIDNPSALVRIVRRAEELASFQKDDPNFVSLPRPQTIPSVKNDAKTVTEKQRAEAVHTIIKKSKAHNITASGAYNSVISELAVANSHGVWTYHVSGASDLSTILLGKTSTGFGAGVGRDASEINAEEVADSAIQKVLAGANPESVKPGEWDVILEPQAVNEMMVFFSFYGPNARIYHEQASFLSGKLGQKVAGDNITIIDDPLNPKAFPMPFDFEGAPKMKVEIIKNGILKNLVYDSYHANKYHAENTGHALPAPNTYGPIPTHLTFKPGTKTSQEMIKGVKKGLLLTRLWYVRVLNPKSLSVTGMTRDGLFLIENGRIVRGVKNLRFNQSIPAALNNVVEVSRELTPLSSFELELGINRMPYLHIKNWNFTSETVF